MLAPKLQLCPHLFINSTCFATWCHRLIVVTELEAFLAMSTTVVQLLCKGHDDPVEVMTDQLTASAIGNLFAVGGGYSLVLIIFFYFDNVCMCFGLAESIFNLVEGGVREESVFSKPIYSDLHPSA